MLFLAFGTFPNHNKNHSKIFFPHSPHVPSHTQTALMVWYCGAYPRTQSQLGLTHFMWWSCSFVEKPFVTGGVRVCWHSLSLVFISLPFTSLFTYHSVVFIPLFVLILSSPLTFPLARFLCLCQCLHTNVKWLCSSFMVTVITELRCIVGAFKGRILHQRFTCAHIHPQNQVAICSAVPKIVHNFWSKQKRLLM